MSTLRSGIDELRGTELRFLSDGDLEGRLDEITRASGVLEAERARTVAEIERRGIPALSGHLSITSWVEHRTHTTWSEAARQVARRGPWITCRRCGRRCTRGTCPPRRWGSSARPGTRTR